MGNKGCKGSAAAVVRDTINHSESCTPTPAETGCLRSDVDTILWLVQESALFPPSVLPRFALISTRCAEVSRTTIDASCAAAFRRRFPCSGEVNLPDASMFNPCYPNSIRPQPCRSVPRSWGHLLQMMQSEVDESGHAAAPLAQRRRREASAFAGAVQWMQDLRKAGPEPRAVCIGLDAAGKTTIMYKMDAAPETTMVCMTVPSFQDMCYGNMKLCEFDLGGQEKIRPLFRHWYAHADAVVFVIDANDFERIPEAARELHAVLNESMFLKAKRIPVLVLANKQDLALRVAERRGVKPLTTQQLWHMLHLSAFDQGILPAQFGCFDICLQPCEAMDGRGLYEGFEWLQSQVPEFRIPRRSPKLTAEHDTGFTPIRNSDTGGPK